MGDILFLAHRLPYPPDRGDRIRSWHVLQALAKLAPVHVCALIDDEADRVHVAKVETVAASVSVVHRRKTKWRAIAEALVTGGPASVAAFIDRDLLQVVREQARHVTTIYAFSGQMAAYIPDDFAGRVVMDFVDMDSAKFEQSGGFANAQEAKRLLAWEIAAARHADVALFVSNAEAALFTEKTGCPAKVLENGIDLDWFAPDVVVATDVPHPLIVFTGQMDYAPNINAVTRFAKESLPSIRRAVPDARFAIVGRAPTKTVRALANEHVIVTGEVADTRPWLAAADVVVAPLMLARGVQNKVLEAMAMGKACVVSPGASLGVDVVDGRDLIVAEDAATSVIELLTDREHAQEIGRAARARMVARYGWDAQMAPLAGILGT